MLSVSTNAKGLFRFEHLRKKPVNEYVFFRSQKYLVLLNSLMVSFIHFDFRFRAIVENLDENKVDETKDEKPKDSAVI